VALCILCEVNLELHLIHQHTAIVHVHLNNVVITTLNLLRVAPARLCSDACRNVWPQSACSTYQLLSVLGLHLMFQQCPDWQGGLHMQLLATLIAGSA
jgi:hypothetical protein